MGQTEKVEKAPKASWFIGLKAEFQKIICPNQANVIAYAEENSIVYDNYENLLEANEIQNLFRTEIDSRVNAKTGFRTCERIFKFVLLKQSFQVGKEINMKMELMRHAITGIYKKEIKKIFLEK